MPIIQIILIIFAVLFSINIVTFIPNQKKKIKDFKENYIKVNSVIVGYDTHYSSKHHSHTYSPVCVYTDENGQEHKLFSNIYTSGKPMVGTVREIYVNPKNPDIYYNGIRDLTIPLFLVPIGSCIAVIMAVTCLLVL